MVELSRVFPSDRITRLMSCPVCLRFCRVMSEPVKPDALYDRTVYEQAGRDGRSRSTDTAPRCRVGAPSAAPRRVKSPVELHDTRAREYGVQGNYPRTLTAGQRSSRLPLLPRPTPEPAPRAGMWRRLRLLADKRRPAGVAALLGHFGHECLGLLVRRPNPR